jgi:hypothetical protein
MKYISLFRPRFFNKNILHAQYNNNYNFIFSCIFFFLSFYCPWRTFAASTTFFHLFLSILSSKVNPWAHLFISSLTLSIQRCLGRPLGLFPLIFHSRTFFRITFDLHTWPTHSIRLLLRYALIPGFW